MHRKEKTKTVGAGRCFWVGVYFRSVHIIVLRTAPEKEYRNSLSWTRAYAILFVCFCLFVFGLFVCFWSVCLFCVVFCMWGRTLGRGFAALKGRFFFFPFILQKKAKKCVEKLLPFWHFFFSFLLSIALMMLIRFQCLPKRINQDWITWFQDVYFPWGEQTHKRLLLFLLSLFNSVGHLVCTIKMHSIGGGNDCVCITPPAI